MAGTFSWKDKIALSYAVAAFLLQKRIICFNFCGNNFERKKRLSHIPYLTRRVPSVSFVLCIALQKLTLLSGIVALYSWRAIYKISFLKYQFWNLVFEMPSSVVLSLSSSASWYNLSSKYLSSKGLFLVLSSDWWHMTVCIYMEQNAWPIQNLCPSCLD